MLNIDGLFHGSACTYIVYYSNILTTIQKFEYTYVNHFKRHSIVLIMCKFQSFSILLTVKYVFITIVLPASNSVYIVIMF